MWFCSSWFVSHFGAVTAKTLRGAHEAWAWASTAGPRSTPVEMLTWGSCCKWSKLATLAYTGSIGGREGERDGRVGAEA